MGEVESLLEVRKDGKRVAFFQLVYYGARVEHPLDPSLHTVIACCMGGKYQLTTFLSRYRKAVIDARELKHKVYFNL